MTLVPSDDYRIDPDRSSASFTVIDRDPTPTLHIEPASASEGDGSLEFDVTLRPSPGSRKTVTVEYVTVQGGTAEAVTDYLSMVGTLTFDPLQTTNTISVPLIDDQLAEDDETFRLFLDSPSNAVFPNGQDSVTVTGTITDDEPVVSVAARNAEVNEGDQAVFDFTRTGDSQFALTLFFWASVPGETGDQAVTTNESVTFGAGETSASWQTETPDNDQDEPDAAASVGIQPLSSLGLPDRYHVGDDWFAAVAVLDDDEPRVSIAAVLGDRVEGEDVEFILTRDGDLSDSLAVKVRVTGGDDFITGVRPLSATFDANAATAKLTVSTVDDDPVDDDDTMEARIIKLSGYRLGDPDHAMVALFDSERQYPVVSIQADRAVVDEGENVAFTLSRSRYGLDESLTVRVRLLVTTANRSRQSPYSTFVDKAVSDAEVVFDAGSSTASIVRPTMDEELNDGNSTVAAIIRLGQYSIRPYPGVAVVWVKDDDIPTVTMLRETDEAFEDFPNRAIQFTTVRTGDTSGFLKLKHVVWEDRRFPPGVLSPTIEIRDAILRIPKIKDDTYGSIGPGASTRTIPANPHSTGPLGTTSYFEVLPFYCGDDVPGTCGYRPQYQVGTPSSTTFELLNRNMGVRVVADQPSVEEGESASFTLERYGGPRGASQLPLTVRVQVAQNGEFIDGVPPETVTFQGVPPEDRNINARGATTAVVTIATADDVIDEASGAITLTILAPDPELSGDPEHSYDIITNLYWREDSGYTNVATVEVLDNDDSSISIGDASANEADGSMEFTVTLANSQIAASVDWATVEDADGDHPATSDQDYQAGQRHAELRRGRDLKNCHHHRQRRRYPGERRNLPRGTLQRGGRPAARPHRHGNRHQRRYRPGNLCLHGRRHR